MALSGSTIDIGGNFDEVDGELRNRAAAVDATTGDATAWDPDVNAPVRAIAVSGCYGLPGRRLQRGRPRSTATWTAAGWRRSTRPRGMRWRGPPPPSSGQGDRRVGADRLHRRRLQWRERDQRQRDAQSRRGAPRDDGHRGHLEPQRQRPGQHAGAVGLDRLRRRQLQRPERDQRQPDAEPARRRPLLVRGGDRRDPTSTARSCLWRCRARPSTPAATSRRWAERRATTSPRWTPSTAPPAPGTRTRTTS